MRIRKQLPAHARVEHLKKQAKDLLREVRNNTDEAVQRVHSVHPRYARELPPRLLLADAQLVVAREYGSDSWAKLRQRVEAIDLSDPATAFIRAACIPQEGTWHGSGSLDQAEAVLTEHSEVATASVFTAAILGDDATVGRFLDQGLDVEMTGGLYDWDALTYLCFSRYLRIDRARSDGFVRTARLLLEHGADANTGFYGDSHEPEPSIEPVLYGAAALAQNAELTRLLLEHGADPNDGETPYHVPEGYDNATLRLLVESGKLNVESLTTMLARKHDWHDYDGIAWLLAHGANPNTLSAWGRRALHQALERNNAARFIELLLEHGANPVLESTSGKSAISLAARVGRGDALDLFARYGFNVSLSGADALLAACAHAQESRAHVLASEQPGLVALLQQEDPGILADVAGAGNTDAVRILLDLGFDIASRTRRTAAPNDTALHVAAWRGRHATAKLLIEREAPLEAINGRDETPLAYAVRASEWIREPSTDTIGALLDAGARVEAVKLFPSGFDEADQLLRRHGKR